MEQSSRNQARVEAIIENTVREIAAFASVVLLVAAVALIGVMLR